MLVDRVQEERQVAAMLRAAGEDVELPTIHDMDVAIGMSNG